jgi:hypothetical protein
VIKQINHNLDKPTRGSHEPLSLTWKGRFIELLNMVAYLNFEIPGFQSNFDMKWRCDKNIQFCTYK